MSSMSSTLKAERWYMMLLAVKKYDTHITGAYRWTHPKFQHLLCWLFTGAQIHKGELNEWIINHPLSPWKSSSTKSKIRCTGLYFSHVSSQTSRIFYHTSMILVNLLPCQRVRTCFGCATFKLVKQYSGQTLTSARVYNFVFYAAFTLSILQCCCSTQTDMVICWNTLPDSLVPWQNRLY